MDNLRHYNKLRQPPKTALKEIRGGRMSGKTDINPQWRYEAMTEVFGPVGFGWTYEIVKLWLEPNGEQVAAFSEVRVKVKEGDQWSEWVPGIGGSMFVAKEKAGLYLSDECYKMATTDALSVALKVFGVAGDIYAGLFDGSKYKDQPEAPRPAPTAKPEAVRALEAIAEPLASDYEGKYSEYPITFGKHKGKTLNSFIEDQLNVMLGMSSLMANHPELEKAITSHLIPLPF